MRPPSPATLGPWPSNPEDPRALVSLVFPLEGVWQRGHRGEAVRRGPHPPSSVGVTSPPTPPTARPGFPVHTAAPSPLMPAEKHCLPAISVPLPAPRQILHLRKQMLTWSSWGLGARNWLISHQGACWWGPLELQTRWHRPQHPAKCLVNLNCRKEFSKSPVITGVSC